MKKLSFIICALVLTVMTLNTPVHAIDNNMDRATYNTDTNMDRVNYNDDVNTRNVTTATDTNEENDTPWEWLGLLGLFGLLGLRRRNRDEKVR
ncbi:hypothetical protein FZC66_10145 [Priestia megaterium]|nr:hypothetical protein FZC66_10145 [Priestia megaterium]